MSKSPQSRGFGVVLRGYDRQQVDAYLSALSEAGRPVAPPTFAVVGRGYDREQVDARIRDLLADRDADD